MAITTDGLTHWNVVDTGTLASAHVDNGGAFWTGGSGTDKTNGAPTIFTDLVIDAVTNTNVTSAANPFGASDVGNYINITGGSGFTTGRYRVVSVAGVIATLDSAVGTVGSTGGAGRLGGALPSPGAAGAAIGSSVNQRIWLRGTHLKTVNTSNVDGGFITLNDRCILMGYTTTRGDAGRPTSTMMPVINSNSAAGTQVLAISTGVAAKVIGIRFEQGTSYRLGLTAAGLSSWEGCYVNGGGLNLNGRDYMLNCVVVVNNASNSLDVRDATFHGCTFLMSAIRFVGGSTFDGCIFIRSDTGEILANTTSDRALICRNCTFVNTSGYIADLTVGSSTNAYLFHKCHFYTVGGDACVRSDDGSPARMYKCAYNVAPSNAGSYPFVNDSPVLLSGDPFVNRAGGNYALTAAAKAALRISGSTIIGLPSTSVADWIGAIPINTPGARRSALLGGSQYAY